MQNELYELGRNYYWTGRNALNHYKNSLLDHKPKILVLVYHRILPVITFDALRISITLSTFEKQIETLARRYPIISINDAIKQCKEDKPKEKLQVVLTFDDGHRDQYNFVFPFLKKKGLPAVIFLTAGHIERELPLDEMLPFSYPIGNIKDSDALRSNCMSWDEARKMSDSGIEVGSHGLSHLSLARILFSKAQDEIKISKEIIEERTGKPCSHFAFPFGAKGDFNQQLIDYAKEAGFKSCMLNIHGYNNLKKDRFCFKRFIMEEKSNLKYLLG